MALSSLTVTISLRTTCYSAVSGAILGASGSLRARSYSPLGSDWLTRLTTTPWCERASAYQSIRCLWPGHFAVSIHSPWVRILSEQAALLRSHRYRLWLLRFPADRFQSAYRPFAARISAAGHFRFLHK